MADNAPNAIDFSPRPNVICQLQNKRVKMHVATISYASGTPSVVAASSSPGISVTDTDTGRITIAFPAGGTGAVGFTVIGAIEKATPNGQTSLELDQDVTNYATGALELTVWDEDNTSGIAAAGDIDLKVTLLIYVVSP